ncbi:MAG: phosphatidylglycerophosphatase A [Candidatus Acidiferrales bacterium]|jgi:phosphatidylglycerophosphatase A
MRHKPRFALFIATACGLGYIPIAPGTWGSLLGVALTWINVYVSNANLRLAPPPANGHWTDRAPEANFLASQVSMVFVILIIGLWAANRAAKYFQEKDPQRVVIDEVSGQTITYLGLLTAGRIPHSWKYLLLGLILFRLFDIWKPFPARQAESLPGGWGIMADDWVAGLYAAIGLWVARAAGL